MDFLIFREIAVVLAGVLGAWTDLKTGEIPDWITYPLIAFGIILGIIEANWIGLGIGALVFGIGYLLYYTGKIGGGDVKLFSGIAFALPFYIGVIFILPVLLYSALTAVVFLSVFYTVKLVRLKKLDLKENRQGIFNAAIIGIALIAYFWIMLNSGFFQMQNALVLAIPMFFALIFMALEKSIRKNFFAKTVKIKDLEEDELIAWDFLPEKTKKLLDLKFKRIIDEKLKAELKKEKISEILVYRDLPRFAPFILAGIILTILRPELVAGIFKIG